MNRDLNVEITEISQLKLFIRRSPFYGKVHNSTVNYESCVYDGVSWDDPNERKKNVNIQI